jgi:ubiquinone biosynthesis protein COQ4
MGRSSRGSLRGASRSLRAWVGALRLFFDPNRLDQVFVLDDALSDEEELENMLQALRAEPEPRAAILQRPRLGELDVARLAELPDGSLGRTFAEHLRRNNLDPAAIPTLVATDDRSFVQAHLYETHDIWHAVTGFDTDVAGELGMQAFYRAQIPGRLAPLLISGGLLQTMLFRPGEWDQSFRAVVRGWLLGRAARPLFGIRWAELWSTPIEEVRASLGIDLGAVDRLTLLDDQNDRDAISETRAVAISNSCRPIGSRSVRR